MGLFEENKKVKTKMNETGVTFFVFQVNFSVNVIIKSKENKNEKESAELIFRFLKHFYISLK